MAKGAKAPAAKEVKAAILAPGKEAATMSAGRIELAEVLKVMVNAAATTAATARAIPRKMTAVKMVLEAEVGAIAVAGTEAIALRMTAMLATKVVAAEVLANVATMINAEAIALGMTTIAGIKVLASEAVIEEAITRAMTAMAGTTVLAAEVMANAAAKIAVPIVEAAKAAEIAALRRTDRQRVRLRQHQRCRLRG